MTTYFFVAPTGITTTLGESGISFEAENDDAAIAHVRPIVDSMHKSIAIFKGQEIGTVVFQGKATFERAPLQDVVDKTVKDAFRTGQMTDETKG